MTKAWSMLEITASKSVIDALNSCFMSIPRDSLHGITFLKTSETKMVFPIKGTNKNNIKTDNLHVEGNIKMISKDFPNAIIILNSTKFSPNPESFGDNNKSRGDSRLLVDGVFLAERKVVNDNKQDKFHLSSRS